MADFEKPEAGVDGANEDGAGKFADGMAVLDFDVLCSTVAMQTQGKWRRLEQDEDGNGGDFGGVLRMWEGEILDCFDDHRIALETACCPCSRFGKNMRRAGFGSCFIQGTLYFILAIAALLSCIAFVVTWRHCFLYLAVAFTISVTTYSGFFRTQTKKKFNIRGSDNAVDDCVYHLICPCCTLCQESRTLEMNNVQDGIWHGRGDTICIGSYGEGSKALLDLHPPPPISTKSSNTASMQRSANGSTHSWASEVAHSETLVPSSQ
ncbi:cell number regulator 5 [Malania oleifera]|uniref:cell number regulator 5 n=1 Tax=Malania oleifera TaxID=397392 RepID=UPI0025ADC818|nr:cell number regulator 5 [Malania oleifera]